MVATNPICVMTIRSPAVAGTFYPATPDALDRVVRAALASAQVDPAAAKAVCTKNLNPDVLVVEAAEERI
jgi:predicted class III extradiol MEMO1 family dioxygenase